jgi:hypothetical protein
MIVVKIELWPGGNQYAAKEIARAEIWNESNLAPISKYGYELTDDHGRTQIGMVTHQRKHGIWRLLATVMQEAFIG